MLFSFWFEVVRDALHPLMVFSGKAVSGSKIQRAYIEIIMGQASL